MNQALVQDVVAEVMKRLGDRSASGNGEARPIPNGGASAANARRPAGVRAGEDAAANEPQRKATYAQPHSVAAKTGEYGIFSSVDEAVSVATEAQKKLVKLSMDERDGIVKLIKSTAAENAQAWGKMELEETKIGRLDHKIEKLQILESRPRGGIPENAGDQRFQRRLPGRVRAVRRHRDHHAGHAQCANAVGERGQHDRQRQFDRRQPAPERDELRRPRRARIQQGDRRQVRDRRADHLRRPPTLETAEQIFNHRGIPLLVVTGGPAVARAALAAKKRAIVAGPGNPPVVVDETACLKNAAASIVKGAAYDNNLLCIGEKQVFAVESIFDKLMAQMEKAGGLILNASQIDALTKQAFVLDKKDGKLHVNKDFVGRDASALAAAIGTHVPPTTQLLVGETDKDHPFVQHEQMMPFVPFVRVKNVDEAIDLAIESEHGYRHTAIIHSRNLDTITRFGRRANTTLFVVNGPSPAGLGLGGQGYLSYSIATPTGEGITTPLTFTRYRRVMMTGSLRMI